MSHNFGRCHRGTATAALLSVAVLMLTGCQWPRDPAGTLDAVQGGTLRVGLVQEEPWAFVTGGRPRGLEVLLVERLAEQLDADVEWMEASESEVVAAVEQEVLDLGIGGFVSSDPWSEEVTFTRPYLTTREVVAIPADDPTITSVEGLEVAVERNADLMGLLLEEDAIPWVVNDVGRTDGPVAVEDWRLSSLQLAATEVELRSEDHVFAVRMGENAWLTTVEDYLLDLDREELVRVLTEQSQ